MGHTRGGVGPRHRGHACATDRTATAEPSGALRQATAAAPRRDLGAFFSRPAVPVRRRGVTRSESDARPAHTACVASVARSRRHTSLPSKPLLTASSALLYLSASGHASRALLLLCPALHSQPGSSHLPSDGGCMVRNPLKTLSFVFLLFFVFGFGAHDLFDGMPSSGEFC